MHLDQISLYHPDRRSNLHLVRGVVLGNVSSATFDVIKGYFLSRGASDTYADTMTMLVVDISAILNITPMSFVAQIDQQGIVTFTSDFLSAFNMLRNPSNQASTASTVNNRLSSVSSQVRG